MLYRVHLDIIQYVLCPITFPRKVPISVQETELRIRELLCVFGYALSIFRYSEYNNSYTIIIIKTNVLLPQVYFTLADLCCPL